ncbi:SRPBCC domain-containing protein [Teredinibacter turnerae]|uniref:SRPBCC domain-containing protein n=1 Tax=Teredinibacter turnerae TaxID=2426 RepID=UPI000361DB02|nr:SRPBCC domain-containing protein [Teredinibacter turnerae]
MAKEVASEIDIEASAESVWQELINFSAYPSWNPFVKSIEGTPGKGNKLSILVCPPNNKGMRFKPVVREYEENRKLAWLGHVLFPGIFDGAHSFELVPLGENKTRFVQRETFSGVLLPMFWSKLSTDTHQGFVQMNQALKSRCESK